MIDLKPEDLAEMEKRCGCFSPVNCIHDGHLVAGCPKVRVEIAESERDSVQNAFAACRETFENVGRRTCGEERWETGCAWCSSVGNKVPQEWCNAVDALRDVFASPDPGWAIANRFAAYRDALETAKRLIRGWHDLANNFRVEVDLDRLWGFWERDTPEMQTINIVLSSPDPGQGVLARLKAGEKLATDVREALARRKALEPKGAENFQAAYLREVPCRVNVEIALADYDKAVGRDG